MVNLQVIGTHISSLFNFVFRKRKKKKGNQICFYQIWHVNLAKKRFIRLLDKRVNKKTKKETKMHTFNVSIKKKIGLKANLSFNSIN